MSRKKKRPSPVKVGHLRAYARRGPRDGAVWYWQVGYHHARKLVPLKGLGGWYTGEEIARVLARVLTEGDPALQPERAATAIVCVEHLMLVWTAHQKRRLDRQRIRTATYQSYHASARQVAGVIGAVHLDQVRTATVQHLVDEVVADGRSPRTARQMARIFTMAWRWGRTVAHCPARDLGRVELPKVQRRYRDYTPTEAEAEAIVDALTGWKRILGELLWATGARIGELGTLRWEQADLVAGCVELDGKTGARVVPLGAGLVAQLAAWREESQPGSEANRVLGVTHYTARRAGREAIIAACQELGIRETTPNGFRRLAATELIGAQEDRKTYEGLMGHSWEMGMRIYAQAKASNVRAAAARLGRRERAQVVEFPQQALKG